MNGSIDESLDAPEDGATHSTYQIWINTQASFVEASDQKLGLKLFSTQLGSGFIFPRNTNVVSDRNRRKECAKIRCSRCA